MKRYEKMGLDLTTEEGFKTAMNTCPRKTDESFPCEDMLCCYDCTAEYLFEEIVIKKVKRWETYNGNFKRAADDFTNKLFEESIPASSVTLHSRFADWLMGEIEVEDKTNVK